MADDSSPETTPTGRPASGGTSPSSSGPAPGGRSPLDDLEDDPLMGGGDDPFEGGNPFGSGSLGNEPPALTMTKFWIRQNALLSVGVAFAAGTVLGLLKR